MAATLSERKTYDVNVQEGGANEPSAKVIAWNEAGTQAFSVLTDAGGDIATQTVEIASISVSGEVSTITDRNPFRIRVVKYGNRAFQVEKPLAAGLAALSDQFFTVSNPDVTVGSAPSYTGIVISHAGDSITLNGTGGTPVNDMNRLYDQLQSEDFDNPQFEYITGQTVFEILSTGDKVNYVMNYDLIVDGFLFDGQDRSINFGTGRELTIQGAGGDVQDLAITGDIILGTGFNQTAFNNLDATGDVDLTNAGAGTYTVTDCTWGSVSSSVGGITLNLSGDSSIAVNNDPGNITIQNTKTFTVTNLTSGSRVQWLTRPGEVLLENLLETGGTAVYSFNYTADTDIWVQILALNEKNRLINAQLLNVDQTLNANQETDPFYLNP